jgi:peptidoglycan hydrolase-like protein with peptidoglycan-binding domain
MLDSEIKAPVRNEMPSSRRRHGLRMLLGGTVVVALGAAGGVYALQAGGGTATRNGSALPTVTVVRDDMTRTTDVDGTLSYADSYIVLAGGSGRITWLPEVGEVIRRGERAYGVDGYSVPLFYGSMPFWRSLQRGMSNGYDVLELERNLAALGYGDDLTVDRRFTWATAAAIKDWQDDLGVTKTGVLTPDDVVMQPGALRVTKLQAVPGAPAAGALFTASGTERQITVQLPVSDQVVAKIGAKVRISLPGGKTTTGHISSVGTVAAAGSTNAQSQTGEGTQNATIPVYITLDKASSAGDLDGSPATIGFTSTEHKNALAVPINALLASAEGTYSVNVVDSAGAIHSVPVRLGIFDGDKVEVSGNLTPGMKVQVPRS